MVVYKTMSKFNAPINNTRPVAVVSLADVYEEITSDAYKAITEKLRSLDYESEAKELDGKFAKIVEEVCEGRFVSAAYLIGNGFLGESHSCCHNN